MQTRMKNNDIYYKLKNFKTKNIIIIKRFLKDLILFCLYFHLLKDYYKPSQEKLENYNITKSKNKYRIYSL